MAGAGLSFQAIRLLFQRRVFLRNSDVATGGVVALVESRDGEETSYFPTVRFKTAAGREVTFQSGVGSGERSWTIGESVPVRYRRDRPDAAEIGAFTALWGPTLLFAVLGGAFLLVGVSVLAGWIPVSEPR